MLTLNHLVGFGAVSAAPTTGDPYIANVSLLLQPRFGDAGVVDYSPSGRSVTALGGAAVDAAQAWSGGASALFDGVNDYLSLAANTAFAFGTGDFTIEAVANLNAGADFRFAAIVDAPGSSPYGWYFGGWPSSLRWGDETGTDFSSGVGAPVVGSWKHYVAQRAAGVFSAYIDGVRTFTTAYTVNLASRSTLYVGVRNDATYAFINGRIAALRITKGVARYSGATCAVPTTFFPSA
jgi:hypothetical protein